MQSVSESHSDDAQAIFSARQLFWLPSLYFILHTLEELPGFAAWVSRHFGAMSTESFVFSHIPLILLLMLACYKASSGKNSRLWLRFVLAAQLQFALNALFHLGTAALFLEYSPGMLTAACLALPLTVVLLRQMRQAMKLSNQEVLAALGAGALIALIAIGVLFLR